MTSTVHTFVRTSFIIGGVGQINPAKWKRYLLQYYFGGDGSGHDDKMTKHMYEISHNWCSQSLANSSKNDKAKQQQQ